MMQQPRKNNRDERAQQQRGGTRAEEEAVPLRTTSSSTGRAGGSARSSRRSKSASPLPSQRQLQRSSSHNNNNNNHRIIMEQQQQQRDLVRPYHAQTPTKYRQPLDHPSSSGANNEPPQSSSTTTPQRGGSGVNATTATPVSTATARPSSNPKEGQQQQQQPDSTSPITPTTTQRHFQHSSDFPTATIRYVNVAQRSAFAHAKSRQLISLEEWLTFANNKRRNHRRLSPSYNHLAMLHRLQSRPIVRQIQFSASIGSEADYFCSLQEEEEGCVETKTTPEEEEGNGDRRGSGVGSSRDGRYRSIDPKASNLPPVPPVLSHRKHRLPTRADVGFPNASPEEVRGKQEEVRNETLWEEHSPRLIVLVTSDDLGTAILLEDEKKRRNGKNDSNSGHGCEGIPYAGRELLLAKHRNSQQFGRVSRIKKARPLLRPNPYSMLAPPLDSLPSHSQGWKPRPFHDRPAGMRYCLASPLSVSLPQANREPLVCSFTLYTLPPIYKDRHPNSAAAAAAYHCKRHGTVPAYGKISEEFWFPAGDWSLENSRFLAAQSPNGEFDKGLLSSWLERRQKAIFSFDPLDLVMEGSKNTSKNEPHSVYLVVQVYWPVEVAIDEEKPMQVSSISVTNKHLLKQVSFGVTKFFGTSKGDMQWPGGQVKELQLYAGPEIPESQSSFVERLWGIVHKKYLHQSADDSSSFFLTEDASTLTMDTSDGSRKKGLAGRIFRSPKPSKSRNSPVPMDHAANSAFPCDPVSGRAKVFLSTLNDDFLQALLASPPELIENVSPSQQLSSMLVDVSGDFAVFLDRARAENSATAATHDESIAKRSSLLRLPQPSEPAGYCGSSELREVLYLPARPEKHYDVDSHFGSCRALLNLLYIYPRMLRLHGVGPDLTTTSFIVRIQLLRAASHLDNSIRDPGASDPRPVPCFHNSLPWAGPALLDSVYTRISADWTYGDIESGIPLNDEIKLRLPKVLDGSYLIEFTLLVGDISSDPKTKLTVASRATIPLSSSASKDETPVSRIATIIPNGKHRLELGLFQLQFETRLISSIHVGDPSVAVALRDLPGDWKQPGMSTVYLGRTASSSSSIFSRAEKPQMLLSPSSGYTVAANFQELLHMHLFALVKQNAATQEEQTSMQTLFEFFRKTKLTLARNENISDPERDPVAAFVKKNLDLFDEANLAEENGTERTGEMEEEPAHVLSESQVDNIDNETSSNISMDDSSVRRRPKIARRPERRASGMKTTGEAPFSRIAYGASKIDRMRIEAELRHASSHYATFFDDDETIATAPSLHSSRRRLEQQRTLSDDVARGLSPNGAARRSFIEDNSITGSRTVASRPPDKGQRPIGDSDFAKRVRTAASVMLAPCVGPSLSKIIKTGQSLPGSSEKQRKTTPRDSKLGGVVDDAAGPVICFCTPGSDTEDENSRDHGGSVEQARKPTERKFRGLTVAEPLFYFSISAPGENMMPVGCGKFIYETVLVMWIKAHSDHLRLTSASSRQDARSATVLAIPWHDPSTPFSDGPATIFAFYANMDFLLPLCLKSVVLRAKEALSHKPSESRVIFDENHLRVFDSFVDILSRGLIGHALSGLGSQAGREESLTRALKSTETATDFLIGLSSVLHPEHLRLLLSSYFGTLRAVETEHLSANEEQIEWTEESLLRVRCSRLIRLRSAERLAVLPSFLALNYPMKFSGAPSMTRTMKTTWLNQTIKIDQTESDATTASDPARTSSRDKLPRSGWLAELLIDECLSICGISCEIVVAEAIAHIESSRSASPSLQQRPGIELQRDDLLMFQSMALHGIEIVYELLLRRNSMDRRFQTESVQGRVAALFAKPILDRSISNVRWLSRLDSSHKIRSTWLLSLIYVLQEAPEALIIDFLHVCCDPKDLKIHRFVRLLKLCTNTFQEFLFPSEKESVPTESKKELLPWLLQESFNTICATTNLVVDVCINKMASSPEEQRMIMQIVLDLFLLVLTSPQSPVTHLRAVGGALQALEFDLDLFMASASTSFQHWLRVILSLMNSVSLSVRSIAVDFLVSLLGSSFTLQGSIDMISMVFLTILPEVTAREIALYSVGGYVSGVDDVAKSVWPLRRSIADLEDTNPLDDDRVDPQLSPLLKDFCRACQAVIDGVLVELQLLGDAGSLQIVGAEVKPVKHVRRTFDADEESVYEAASFFLPECAPMQRIRWLLTLKCLQEAKEHWAEAAETLILCAHTICDAIPHAKSVWRPSRFPLWSDSSRYTWLGKVGEEQGRPDRGNSEVMNFAERFLEPDDFLGVAWKSKHSETLQQPTVSLLCELMTCVAKEAVRLYLREHGMEELAYQRLEALSKLLLAALDNHHASRSTQTSFRPMSVAARQRHIAEDASLRRASTSISADMTNLAERLASMAHNEPRTPEAIAAKTASLQRPTYVVVRVYGKMPARFQESTTIPTFLEWEKPCVCRVGRRILEMSGNTFLTETVCRLFGQEFIDFFKRECGESNFVLRTNPASKDTFNDGLTYMDVFGIDAVDTEPFRSLNGVLSKQFYYRKESMMVEITVATEFPCALSRQSALVTTEIDTSKGQTAY